MSVDLEASSAPKDPGSLSVTQRPQAPGTLAPGVLHETCKRHDLETQGSKRTRPGTVPMFEMHVFVLKAPITRGASHTWV